LYATLRIDNYLDQHPSRSESGKETPHMNTNPISGDFSARELHSDVAGVKDSLARAASQASDTVRNVSQTVTSQVGSAANSMTDASSELAAAAKEHAKTFASELEAMARRNPLGMLVGALVVGVVVGMMSRGRS
jgi:phage-related minor tail protein